VLPLPVAAALGSSRGALGAADAGPAAIAIDFGVVASSGRVADNTIILESEPVPDTAQLWSSIDPRRR
jgi:hypothetical protein